jgi:hypothetical protein
MGASKIGEEFEVMVEETGNIKTFVMKDAKWDSEGELQYEVYESKDGKHQFFIWNDGKHQFFIWND